MQNEFNRIDDVVEDARLALEQTLDEILDFCYDPYGLPRALEANETKDLIRMIKELIP